MQRIFDPSAAASLPAPPALTGTTGYFTEGSPGITAATKVRGWWVNMVQEELLALLTAAGVAFDTGATNFTQVLQSIRAIGRGNNHAVWKLVSGTLEWSLNGAAFTTVGASSFTPAYSCNAKLRGIGGGGGTGGAAGTGSSGGGAAGSDGEAIVALVAGTPITPTVGAAGIGGASTTTDGGNGGSSIFDGVTFPGGNGSPHCPTSTTTVGGTTGGAVTGTGVYLSRSGMPGAGAGSLVVVGGGGGTIVLPGQGGGSPFGWSNYGNTAPFTDNWGGGAGGVTGGSNGLAGTPGALILEW